MSLFLKGRPKLQDEIDYLTSVARTSPFSEHVLVYYVTGNPGLIEYYRNFLKFLTQNLSKFDDSVGVSHQTQYHVHGESLAGFQLRSRPAKPAPYSLDEIKEDLVKRIDCKAAEIIEDYKLKQKSLPVILIGHSIGTWLILETIESSQDTNKSTGNRLQAAEVTGGILLFPTVFELAKSPNGVRFGWALQYEHAAFILSFIAEVLLAFIPLFVLTALLQLLLRMPYHPALTTASFLKSKGGVHQALYMAHGELLQVREDKWSDNLWRGQKQSLSAKEARALAKESAATQTKLFFYWGANDHWVANTTRDDMIARRARTGLVGHEKRPLMEVDSHGLPHAFSLHDRGAQIVADRVAIWIKEL